MAESLLSVSWVWTIVLWMDLDARRHRWLPCFEFSFLAAVTYPVSLLWYCLWSRSWRGLLILFGLVGLVYILPWMTAVVLWIALEDSDLIPCTSAEHGGWRTPSLRKTGLCPLISPPKGAEEARPQPPPGRLAVGPARLAAGLVPPGPRAVRLAVEPVRPGPRAVRRADRSTSTPFVPYRIPHGSGNGCCPGRKRTSPAPLAESESSTAD